MNIVSGPVTVNHQFVFRKYRSDKVSALGEINSLTPKSVPAGTKNSRSEGFLLVKHKHTNIPTMMEPFAPPMDTPNRTRQPSSEGVGRGGGVEGI